MADTPYQGFIGATYGGDARHLDAEQCINLYPEPTGAPGTNPKRPLALRHTPGLKAFGMAGAGPVRGIFYDPGVERLFCVSGGEFFEVGEGGSATKLGDVATGVLPVTWASNGVGGQQIMFTSGGRGYVFDLKSDTFHVIEAEYFPANVIACAYIQTYFLALPANSRQFHFSAQFNGLEWSAGDVAQKFAGTAWIDEAALEVRFVEATSVDSISFGLGLAARVSEGAAATMRREQIDDGVWMPTQVTFTGRGRAALFLRGLSIDYAEERFDYRPASEVPIPGAP